MDGVQVSEQIISSRLLIYLHVYTYMYMYMYIHVWLDY